MRINWRDVLKFLSGAFFVTAGASWYFSWLGMSVPFPFFGFSAMTPEFLFFRGFIHFALFLICLYFGFIRECSGDSAPRAARATHRPGPVTAPSDGRRHDQLTNAATCAWFGGPM